MSSRRNNLSIQGFIRYAAHQRALNAALCALQPMVLRESNRRGAVVEKPVAVRHFNCGRGTQRAPGCRKQGCQDGCFSLAHSVFNHFCLTFPKLLQCSRKQHGNKWTIKTFSYFCLYCSRSRGTTSNYAISLINTLSLNSYCLSPR